MKKRASASNATPPAFIESVFKELGVGGSMKPEVFWRQMSKRFGRAAEAFGDAIELRSFGESVDPYELKNQSMEFANAVFSQFDMAKTKAVASWFLNINLQDGNKRVLEVGCDNGVFLIILAKAFPGTQFLGIDSCEDAIALARQRAERLGLNNIRFKVSDVRTMDCTQGEELFDLVIAVTVFHEIFANGLIGEDAGLFSTAIYSSSISESDKQFDLKEGDDAPLKGIKSSLKEDGVLISVDRWPDAYKLLRWVRISEKFGFSVNLPQSYLIECKNAFGNSETLPLTVLYPSADDETSALDVLSFYCYRNLLDERINKIYSDPYVCEIFYEAFKKEPIWVANCDYVDGSGSERFEVGLAAGLGYVYRTTTRGFRALDMFPKVVMNEKIAGLKSDLEERKRISKVVTEIQDQKQCLLFGVV